MKFLKAFLVIITAAAGLAAAALFYMDTPVNTAGDPVPFSISQGESAADIALALEKKNLIRSRFYFMLIARTSHTAGGLRSGVFDVSPALSSREILRHLATSTGRERGLKVTIPEGFTARQVARRLEEKGVCRAEDFLEIVSNPRKYNIDTPGGAPATLEGFLFPETYFLDKDSGCENSVRRMVAQFFKVFTPALDDRAREIGLSLPDAVTLASLIEMEAKVDSERSRISGVLHNRLRAGMLLQCDATIQYALPERKKKLYYKHLEIDSPYNTYLHKGLPPGPICNPGARSLRAALYPEDTKFYYYVARPGGAHIFSRSNDEHIRAKQQAKKEFRAAKNNQGR